MYENIDELDAMNTALKPLADIIREDTNINDMYSFSNLDDKQRNLMFKFMQHRELIDKRIKEELFAKLSDFKQSRMIEVHALSLRQRLLEDIHTLMDMLTDRHKIYKKQLGEAVSGIINDMERRVKTKNERDALIEGTPTMIDEQTYIKILENHIAFCQESKKTVDHILFGIKTRVEIEHMLGS